MKELALTAIAILILSATGCSNAKYGNSNSGASNPALSVRTRDVEISDSVDRRLRDQGLESIDLEVTDGQVTLRGKVNSEEQKKMAEVTVRRTPGVISVSNQITVENKPPVNTNKPGGPQKNGSTNINKPGGPSKKLEP